MKDGGSAFPILDRINDGNGGALVCIANGMTLRDYFAGQMLSVLAREWTAGSAAAKAYRYADAMLAEREKILYANSKLSCPSPRVADGEHYD